MTAWIRYHWDDVDKVSYYEVDDDGWALRQVDLQGPERRPVAAARMDEVLRLRDQGDLAAMRAYENRYGVLVEGSIYGWNQTGRVDEITASDFDEVWKFARQKIDQS